MVKKTTYLDEKYFRLTSLPIHFIYISFHFIQGITEILLSVSSQNIILHELQNEKKYRNI